MPAGVGEYPEGIHVMGPPDGVDPEDFHRRIAELRQTGMPFYNASRWARLEFLGLREFIPARPSGPASR